MQKLPGCSIIYAVLWTAIILILICYVCQITIAPRLRSGVDTSTMIYHCYWKGDLTDHHLLSMLSLINTQQCSKGCIYLWTRPLYVMGCQAFVNDHNIGEYVMVRVFKEDEQAADTILQGSSILYAKRGITEESDKVRLLVLHKYGGLYFDLDVLFIRDMATLYNGPFVYQWSDKDYANTAIMYLGNKYSKESKELMKRVIKVDSFHPEKVFTLRACNSIGITVYSPELFDPLWVDFDNGESSLMGMTNYRDFFQPRKDHETINIAHVFPNSYTHHWHNCWDSIIHSDSIAGMFLEHHLQLYHNIY